jgi:hypothetical protein
MGGILVAGGAYGLIRARTRQTRRPSRQDPIPALTQTSQDVPVS